VIALYVGLFAVVIAAVGCSMPLVTEFNIFALWFTIVLLLFNLIIHHYREHE
jgi:hypothetical protein